MQRIIVFNNKRCKYNMILQDLETLFQNLQKYGQKGHVVILFSYVTKKIFTVKRCVFSKESTWHRCLVAESGKISQKMTFIINVE